MSRELRISSVALRDIDAALEWTLNNFGAKKREQYVDLIRRALLEIASNPTGTGSKHRPDLHRDAWVFHIQRKGKKARHLFVYRILTGGQIAIARFLHDAMDVKRHVDDELE